MQWTTLMQHTAELWQRPRDACCVEPAILRERATLRLNFRLKGCVSRQWPLDGGMVMLQLCDESFHTKKLCSRLHSNEIKFYSKKNTKQLLFEPPFGDLEVTYALNLYLAAKPVVDFLFVISEHLSKSAFFEGGWVTLSANFRRKPLTVGVRKLEWLPLCVTRKYPQCIVWICHKARV